METTGISTGYLIFDIILIIATVSGGLVAIWKNFGKAVYKWIKRKMLSRMERENLEQKVEANTKGIQQLREGQASIKESVEAILYEMKTNGGNSVKDLQLRERTARWFMHDLKGEAVWEYTNINGELVCTRASHPVSEIVGLPLDDVLGNGWISAVAQEYRSAVIDEWTDCLEAGRIFNMQFAFRHKDGKVVHVNSYFHPLVHNGVTVGGIGSLKLLRPDEIRHNLIDYGK